MEGERPPCTQKIYRGEQSRKVGRLRPNTLLTPPTHLHGALWPAYLAIDDGRQAEVVKDLSAVAPHGHRAIFAQALVIKAVDLGDLTALVVAPDQGDSVRIANLQVTTKPGLGSRLCPLLSPPICEPHPILTTTTLPQTDVIPVISCMNGVTPTSQAPSPSSREYKDDPPPHQHQLQT